MNIRVWNLQIIDNIKIFIPLMRFIFQYGPTLDPFVTENSGGVLAPFRGVPIRGVPIRGVSVRGDGMGPYDETLPLPNLFL